MDEKVVDSLANVKHSKWKERVIFYLDVVKNPRWPLFLCTVSK